MKTRTLTGTVVSDKPDQTVIVAIERRVVHPLYRKSYQRTKKVVAHDPDNSKKVGDVVTVVADRPRSATKRWKVISGDSRQSTVASPEVSTQTSAADSRKTVDGGRGTEK